MRFEHMTLPRAVAGGRPGQALIIFDPGVPEDLTYVEKEVRPAYPTAEYRPVWHSGHPCTSALAEMGVLKPLVLNFVAQAASPPMGLAGRKRRSPIYIERLAQHAVQRQRPALALSLLDMLDRIAGSASPDATDQRFTLLQLKGQLLDRLGRRTEALASLDEAVTIRPAHAGCRQHKAVLLWHLNRLQEALPEVEDVIRLAPLRRDAHWLRVGLLEKLGRKAEALAAARAAVELLPTEARCHRQLAWQLTQHGLLEEALAAIEHAAQLDPEAAETLRIRRTILDRIGRSARIPVPA